MSTPPNPRFASFTMTFVRPCYDGIGFQVRISGLSWRERLKALLFGTVRRVGVMDTENADAFVRDAWASPIPEEPCQ